MMVTMQSQNDDNVAIMVMVMQSQSPRHSPLKALYQIIFTCTSIVVSIILLALMWCVLQSIVICIILLLFLFSWSGKNFGSDFLECNFGDCIVKT